MTPIAITGLEGASFLENLDFGSIKEVMDGFDPASLLPQIDGIVGFAATLCRLAVIAGPVVLLVLGLSYLLLSPKEANHYMGYRTTFGMGSVSAWRKTQKLAGLIFTAVGLILTIIMLMVAMTFGSLDAMAMVWRAAKCLIWQAVIIVAMIVTVNTVTAFKFDYRGNKRKR